MGKVPILSVTLALALIGAALGYAHWSKELGVSVVASTGEVDVEFTNCTCSDPLGTVDPGYDKDIAWSECRLVDADGDGDADAVEITVNNAYPSYRCLFELVIHNGGTIPVYVTDARLVHAYGEALDFDGFWTDGGVVGTQIDPCDSVSAGFSLHVRQEASQPTYTFTIEIEAAQWNYSDTGAGPDGDTEGPPTVMCMWVQDATVGLEDGDPFHQAAGAQFLPPMTHAGEKAVQYWAIVADPEGVDAGGQVTADVHHPAGPPRFGSPCHHLVLQKVDKTDVGVAAYVAACDGGLVAYQDGCTDGDIMDALGNCFAEVYAVQGSLDYCQPAGEYGAAVDACDSSGRRASDGGGGLTDSFTYLAASGIEIDFNSIDYGMVDVGGNRWLAGDGVFDLPLGAAPGPNPSTIRNIGNTEVQITIMQDDMGFSTSGPPDGRVWNVTFDARLGSDHADEVVYAPYDEVTLPNKLLLAGVERLDFSIHIRRSAAGQHSGVMKLGCVQVPFAP